MGVFLVQILGVAKESNQADPKHNFYYMYYYTLYIGLHVHVKHMVYIHARPLGYERVYLPLRYTLSYPRGGYIDIRHGNIYPYAIDEATH